MDTNNSFPERVKEKPTHVIKKRDWGLLTPPYLFYNGKNLYNNAD